MTNLQYLMDSVSASDLEWLDSVDFNEACRQLDAAVPYSKVVSRLAGWAQDYRIEANAESMEATRFDADH